MNVGVNYLTKAMGYTILVGDLMSDVRFNEQNISFDKFHCSDMLSLCISKSLQTITDLKLSVAVDRSSENSSELPSGHKKEENS